MNNNRVRNYITTAILFLAFVLLLWLVLGAIWGTWFAVPFVTNEPGDKYEVFNALLTIFLRLATVLIAIMGAVGAGAYYILKHRITEDAKDQTTNAVNERITEAERKFTEVTKAADDRFNKLMEKAENKFNMATEDAHERVLKATAEEREMSRIEVIELNIEIQIEAWRHWSDLINNDMRTECLETAISIARGVKEEISHTKISNEARKQRIEELKWLVSNNLAYLLADWPLEQGPNEQTREERTGEAHQLIRSWYEARKDKLETEQDWATLETCAWVFKKLPMTETDKDESQRIIKVLCRRKDIPKDRPNKWITKYGINLI
mgnify:CR=1 FL=1